MRTTKIKLHSSDEEVEVIPHFHLYTVRDFIGKEMTMPAISLTSETEYGEELFAFLTKTFGEYIGIKNVAYIDTNNCPFADQLLKQGIAKDIGYTKASVFCIYPLWQFDENFLRSIGGAEYAKYEKEFEAYFGISNGECGEPYAPVI